MITQEIPISLLMEPQKNLIFRKGDFGNQIKIKFPDLTGITSAEFRLIKPDDTFVVSTGEIVENDILITITDQMSVKSGLCIFNLRLINNSTNIYTYVGRALIDDNINLDDYAESVAEVNGYTFPDDFALKSEIPSSTDFATIEYVNDAIAAIPTYTPISYSLEEQDTGLKWIDGKHIYQRTFEYSEGVDIDTSGTQLPTVITNELTNVDNFIKAEAIRTTSGFKQACIALWVYKYNGVNVYTAGSWDKVNIFTFWYTKTTDTI